MDNIISARDISGLEPMSALRGLTPLCVPMELENSFAEEARLRANPHVASLWERLGLFYLLEEPQAAPVSNTRVIVNNFTAQLVFRLCTMNHTDRLIERYQPGFVFPENLRRVSQENALLIRNRETGRFLRSFAENSSYAEEVSRVFRLVFEKETGGIPLQTVCMALAALLGSSGGGAVFTAQQRRIFERIASVLGTEYPDSPAAGAIASVGAAAGFTDEQRRNIMNAVGKTGTRPQMDAVRTVFRLAETVKTSGEAEKAILAEVRNYGFTRRSERFQESQSSTERYSGIVPIGFQQDSELPQEGRIPAVPGGIVKPLYGEITSAALLFAESVERSERGERSEPGEHGKRGERGEIGKRGDSGRTGEIGKSGESSVSSVLGESGKSANPHTISSAAERRSAEFRRISEIMSGGFAGRITELLNFAERNAVALNTTQNIAVSNLNSPQLILPESAQDASGSRGSIGSAGSVGSTGSVGSRGLSGSAGTPGVPGDSGIPGAVGRSGLPGVPGSSGVAGVSGDSGAAGVPGKNGADSVGKVSASTGFSAAKTKNPVGAVHEVNTLTRETSEHDSASERIFRESTAARLAERLGAIQGGFGSAYTEMQLFNILHQPERSGNSGVIPLPREATPGSRAAQDSNITRLTQFSDISQLSNVSNSSSVNTVSNFSNVSSFTRVGSTVNQTNAVNLSNAAVTANISNVANAVNVANTVNAANVANVDNVANIANSSNMYSAAETSIINPAENTDVTNVTNTANAASVTNTANIVHNITQTAENPGNPRNLATGEVLPPETARESLQSAELYAKPESVPETASRIVPGNGRESAAGNVPERAPRLLSGTSPAKPVAPTGSYRDRLDSGTLAALDRLISESRTAGKVSEIRETQPEPAELSLNTAEQSAVQGDVLRSVSIVRESMVRRTESHMTRLIERAAESALPKAPETKPFKFRTAEGAENMVMLVPPTEMDRFRAQQSYMNSMPPIELKEPPKAPESAPATTRTITNNRPAVVRTSVDSTVSVDSLTRDEISRLADKVYERIETKLTRERRRMGL